MKNSISKYLTVLVLSFCAIISVMICGCRTKNRETAPQSVTYTVTYVDGTEVFAMDKVTSGDYANNYNMQKDGYSFGGWYCGSEQFDFSTPVTYDLSLTAIWNANIYTVTFVADGKKVSTIQTTASEFETLQPAVPDKQFFTGQWEKVFFGSDLSVSVNARYVPINYTATLFIGDDVYTSIQYNVTEAPQIPAPPVKKGYTAQWDGLPLSGGNRELHLKYTPIFYTVNFIADDIVCAVSSGYTVETELSYPAVPSKEHYTAKWSELSFSQNCENVIEVHAIYTPVTYFATFIAENKEIAKLPFNIENTEITAPTAPAKTGYDANWENYNVTLENFSVKAIYTPIDYTVTFIAGDQKVDEVKFNIENRTVTHPEVPAKRGYSGSWQQYELDLKDITVYAEYELTFKDEFSYVRSADKTYYTVTGYKGSEDYIIIPATHNNLPVKAVADDAFLSKNYTYVEIQNNIEHIGTSAFQACLSMEEIVLPDTLKTIGDYAFSYCEFKNINLPDSLESIGEYAFTYCKFENIKLSNSLESIGERCFANSELTEITIPENVKTIGKYAFYKCEKLESAKFDNCTADVSEFLFEDCIKLSTVTFGNSITKICSHAFKNCVALKSVVIPINIEYLAELALYETGLTNISIEGENEWSLFEQGNLFRIGYVTRREIIDTTDAAYLLSNIKSRYIWQRDITDNM